MTSESIYSKKLAALETHLSNYFAEQLGDELDCLIENESELVSSFEGDWKNLDIGWSVIVAFFNNKV
jgi:hypothetical protein